MHIYDVEQSIILSLLCSYLFQSDDIDQESFTFEKFYELYHKICPRADIEDLFNELLVISAFSNRIHSFVQYFVVFAVMLPFLCFKQRP